MTGGRSTHGNGKKWEEKDVQGQLFCGCAWENTRSHICVPVGLQKTRDKYMHDLAELSRTRPRGNTDDNLLAEISRLEPALTVARDDLVRTLYLTPGTTLTKCVWRHGRARASCA